MIFKQQSVKTDWLFSTLSKVLQADRLVWGNSEMATLNIIIPFYSMYANYSINMYIT